MQSSTVLNYLTGRDRRSIGRVTELIKIVRHRPNLLAEVIEELWNPNPVVAMRAADAAEKLTRGQSQVLELFKNKLLELAQDTRQQELRWHLASMLPRLQLSPSEQRQAFAILERYLEDKSSIVKTFALQALFDLTVQNAALKSQVAKLLKKAGRNGTAAMRARSRKLRAQLEQGESS